MIPRRVTAPADSIVPLGDMRDHLRVSHDDEDATIAAMMTAAESYLDGWRGVLGRCVMPQQWAVDYPSAGCWRLPFPDVTAVTASVGTATLSHDSLGSVVTISDAATVTMSAQLPDDAIPTVQAVVKLLVGHWFANREAVTGDSLSQVPLAVDALLAPIRWVRV